MDSNTYIQAKNLHYNMDFCPAFWEWLDKQFEQGQVMSVDNVYIELTDSNDELSSWAKNKKYHFLPVSDIPTQDMFTEIANHVVSLINKSQADIANFLSKADPWIIAKAAAIGATVVTHEALVPDNSQKVKIPNICEQFGVEYINTYQLLFKLKAKFILGN
ncbi:DUF4411 family protein [Paraglaciecola sp.]|uniref:DUF4411 family protein n=1 Tax=Paraglaciecola sp. TaxID=1920173 RepID=UPI00273DF882|nr:DUF4411 family protein [Paraglaciecola sp.]MDP5030215.1 DUF4411 family protein [Paraglaciecola sp.]